MINLSYILYLHTTFLVNVVYTYIYVTDKVQNTVSVHIALYLLGKVKILFIKRLFHTLLECFTHYIRLNG